MDLSGYEAVRLLLLLSLLWEPAAPRCAVSLGYDFTVRTNGQPWCDIEGRVNGNTFLHFTCGGQFTLTSVPDMNATRAWGEQRDTLQSVVEELRVPLLDMRAEIPAAGGPLALQGSMACQRESSGCTSASWQFGSDGQPSLRFDSTNGHWTVLRGEGRRLKTALAGDRAMTHLLVMTSTGDCRQWLQQVVCTQAASATATATVPSKATANRPVSSVLPGMPTCAIIVGLLGWAFT
ncbi:UL16-binding protein 3-like [Pipistrellus kuhlii]|uniref:UL16-binding protein 3-like n=1 Tax=Pipistrellus kuhlii TaxID=59472 RepID=UPI001E273E8E|nr:UL16-binding protein 3-like [Pipistrellus kuhlii]